MTSLACAKPAKVYRSSPIPAFSLSSQATSRLGGALHEFRSAQAATSRLHPRSNNETPSARARFSPSGRFSVSGFLEVGGFSGTGSALSWILCREGGGGEGRVVFSFLY